MFTVSHSVGQTNLPYSEVVLGNERKKMPILRRFQEKWMLLLWFIKGMNRFFPRKKNGSQNSHL